MIHPSRRAFALLFPVALSALAVVLLALPALQQPAAATVKPAASIAATDDGTFNSTLFPQANRFPGASPQRSVVRDCGLSAALPNNQTLWVFCDTATFDNITGTEPNLTGSLHFVGSSTAALATTSQDPTAAQPVSLNEASFPAYDTAFLSSAGTYGTSHQPIECVGGANPVAWSDGLVTLPGTSTVLDFYQDHCPDTADGYPGYDEGVAEFTATASSPGDFSSASSLQVSANYPSVLINPNPGSSARWGYGAGAVADATYVYVYSVRTGQYSCTAGTCTTTSPGAVNVARVPWANGQYQSSANYQYYTGNTLNPWVSDPTQAVDIMPDTGWPAGDGMSVGWYPSIGRYVMSEGDSPLGGGAGMSLRTSTTPWGPWTAPIDVSPQAQSSLANPDGGCNAPTTCRTFLLHPELTGTGSNLYFSYIRNGDIAAADGTAVTFSGAPTMQVRLGSIPLADLPVPAPDTQLTSAPTDPSNVDPATFTFGVSTRPATPGDPADIPAGAPGPISYLCSLDGATPSACTSPASYPGLANGRHTFTVQAVDGQGVADPSPASWSWSVDRTPPTTTILAGPPSPSDQPGSVFRFTGSDDQTPVASLRYLCSLDYTTAVLCTSPYTPSGLTSGTHTLLVAAVDKAGNMDPTPATWTWTVDTDPVVSISSGPPAYTSAGSASIAFSLSDDHTSAASLAASATCSLDGATPSACSSPVTVSGLSAGPHVMTISTVDSIGDPGTATWRWIVDTVAPHALLSSNVSGSVSQTTATMTLSGMDDRAPANLLTYLCSQDSAPFAACTSPDQLSGLASGPHTFALEAVDPAGNVSNPVSVSWTVDTTPPTVTISAGPAATTSATTAAITFTGSDDQTPVASLGYQCTLDGTVLGACTSPLELSNLLPGAHNVTVQSVDAAGNMSVAASYNWTVQFVIVGDPPPLAYTGMAYSSAFATNEPAGSNITYKVTSGTLPPAFMLTSAGVLSGTPAIAGNYGSVTVTATAPWGTASQTFTLNVMPTSSITGSVTNRETGAPLGGIRVRAFNSTGLVVATTATDENGTFDTGYLKPGAYRLSFVDVTLVNYVPDYSGDVSTLAAATAVTTADGTTVRMNATLDALNAVGGIVTDQVSGAPLPGRRVTLYNSAGKAVTFTTTDTNGHYEMDALTGGSYTLGFVDPTLTHINEFWNNEPTLATATPIVLSGGGMVEADAGLVPYTTISGIVTDSVTQAPLSGVNVSLLNSAGKAIGLTTTSATGSYSFNNLQPATYSLCFADPTHAHVVEYWNNQATAATATPIVAGGGTITANAGLAPYTAVSGTVTDQLSGQRLSGIQVSIYSASGSLVSMAVTNSSGAYLFPSLTVGAYRLKFTDPSGFHVAEYYSNQTTLATATPINLAGGSVDADAGLTPLAAITGHATDSSSGSAIAGIWVSLYTPSGTLVSLVATAADGSYHFANLALGSYRIEFSDPQARYKTVYWSNETSLATSTPIDASAAGSITVNAALATRTPAVTK